MKIIEKGSGNMDLITNIVSGIENNLPTIIAKAIEIIILLTYIIVIIRKGQEIFGEGNKLVRNVVSSFTKTTNELASVFSKLVTDMRKEFNEQLQLMQQDNKTTLEIISAVMLAKSVPSSLKQEIVSKASSINDSGLKKYIVDLVKTDKPISQTIQLAEVKEIKPTKAVDKVEPTKIDKVQTYIPTSE